MTRSLLLSAALAALSLTTGCGFASGALLGGMFGEGEEPWMTERVPMSGELGTSIVCLGVDAEPADLDPSAGVFEVHGRFAGTVYVEDLPESFDNLVPCWHPPEYAMQVEAPDGALWTVGYAWIDAYDWDMTPWPSVNEGAAVELLFRADLDSEANGFVLTQRGELAYAMESGRDGRALQDGDIPGVRFSSDQVVSTSDTDCGARESLAQQFDAGDSSLTLYPGEDQGFEVDGDYVTTCSIDSWRMPEGQGCEDELTLESSFVMFR